jgi:hypothetical protein
LAGVEFHQRFQNPGEEPKKHPELKRNRHQGKNDARQGHSQPDLIVK